MLRGNEMKAFVYSTESMEVVAVINGKDESAIEAAFNYDTDTHGMCYTLTADLTMSNDVEQIEA